VKVNAIVLVYPSGEQEELWPASEGEVERHYGTMWRTRTGRPAHYVPKGHQIRLVPIPTAEWDGQKLKLNVFRLPLADLELDDEPEIEESMQDDLIFGLCAQAYRLRSVETPQTPTMIRQFEDDFIRVFGPPLSATQRQAGCIAPVPSLFSLPRNPARCAPFPGECGECSGFDSRLFSNRVLQGLQSESHIFLSGRRFDCHRSDRIFAQMQARLKDDDDEVLTGFDLTTANGGLEIVQTDVTLADGTLVEQAWGVALKVSYTVTQAIDWTKALFSIDIENDGVVTPIAMGELLPKEQATRWQAP